MSFGHALYYPNIEITDEVWLKHAFLFWDKLSRIVPSSVTPNDSENVKRIKDETGFIEDYSPEDLVISETFNSFSLYLEGFIRSNKHQKHSVSPGTYYIHIGKLNENLKNRLIDLGLAKPGKKNWEGYIRIDNEIGWIYMTYLARVISKNKSLPVVTNSKWYFDKSIKFDSEVFRDYDAEFEYKLGNLLIKQYIPKNIDKISFDKLIKFRNKYSDERSAYFDEIVNLCQGIPIINNESELKDALEHHGKSLKNKTEELKKVFESNKIKTVEGILRIAMPSSLIQLLSPLFPINEPLALGSGALLGFAFMLNKIKEEKNNLHKNPLSYLLSMNSKFSDKGFLKR